MESVSIFEGLSTDWLMLAGLVFLLPKILFGSLAVLVINAEKVPFLDRLLGDRVKNLKKNLRINPFLLLRRGTTAVQAGDSLPGNDLSNGHKTGDPGLHPVPKDR